MEVLTREQKERYARQIVLKGVGEEGQMRLLKGRVLVIGAGGLGSPASMYLAAAGVGTLGIADADKVDVSNLQRQIAHGTEDVGTPKTESARQTINKMNPDVTVHAYEMFVNEENIMELLKNYDFVIDATDNFTSKFLINDACVKAGKPFCHAGILGFQGQIMTYVPGKGPCYRCIFQNPPGDEVPDCKQTGVIGAAAGVIGSLQAMEALKYLLGAGELLTGTLLTYDALRMEFRTVKLPGYVPNCPVCGKAGTYS